MKERFPNWKYPEFDENGMTRWGWKAIHRNNFKIGRGTDIGAFTFINAEYGVHIGKNVQIGSHCSICSADTERGVYGRVYIGDNALIGSHCVILPGVRIEAGSKIPCMSVIKE